MRIQTFDTTLRDGTQGEAVSFSVEDKVLITHKLDELGIDYIEGGWPGSNPKDKEFFARARDLKLKHARLTAFGSTRLAKNPVHEDRNVRELVDAGTPVIAIFGKSWDLHVHRALGISLEENLKLISETVGYLKDHGKEVVYDAEHFFDGYIHNRDYALQSIEAAKLAGADVLCLCDTNGGTLTEFLEQIVSDVRARFDGVVGIHVHNDSDVAVANTLAAVRQGASHVQGCLNGYGERCGNANLASVIANLELKLGHQTIGPDKLQLLTSTARYISELANLQIPRGQAYVGQSAFAHKGGIHVSAVLKDSSTYEHIAPELVGNQQRVLVSDLSGRSNVDYMLRAYGSLADRLSGDARRALVDRVKQAEYDGYDLEAADGTFELFVRQALYPGVQFFDVLDYEVNIRSGAATAAVKIGLRDGEHAQTAIGSGPVHALDVCLRQCLSALPGISDVRLTDYKVRVLDSGKGTAAKVRVLVEWSDHQKSWSTVGVSDDVIQASWEAMVNALQLELMRLLETDADVDKVVADYCWAHSLSVLALAQWVSPGVTGGIPVSPHTQTIPSACTAGQLPEQCGPNDFYTKPYAIGPTVDINFPWRFSIETGMLYERLHRDVSTGLVVGRGTGSVNFGQRFGVAANAWLFPVLLRYDLPRHHRVTPFVEAGATLRHAGTYDGHGFQLDFYLIPQPMKFEIASPKAIEAAITAGAGIRYRAFGFNFAPEIRYLHWTSAANQPVRDQAMMMLGITFPGRK